MLTRLASLSLVTLLLLCAQAGAAPDPVNAETTGVAVIACENFAPYLDGDPGNVTTPAEFDLACLQAIPPTGALSIQALANGVGDTDGTLEQADLQALDDLDHNRIDETCTYQAVVVDATKPAIGCTLLVFVFLDDEKPVTLDTPSGLGSIESGGENDFFCFVEGAALGQDADCSELVASDGDRVVIFRVLNINATNGQAKQVNVSQEAVSQSFEVVLSPETRSDPNAANDFDGDQVLNNVDNCPNNYNPNQSNLDSAPIVTPGIAPADTTIPNGGDGFGDACDVDGDNDGFTNYVEANLRPFDPLHALLCLHATEDTNPLLADTDGDRVLDRAECQLGSNPLDPNARPPVVVPDADADGLYDAFETGYGFNPNNADTDGDAIGDGVEFKGYNTSPLSGDTDSDGCSDNLEITSVDANQAVNSLDLLIVALSFNQTDRPNPDINKNGIVNATDLLIVALNFATAACNTPD